MPNDRRKVISQNIPPIIIGGTLSIVLHLGLLYLSVHIFPEEIELYEMVIIVLITFFIPALVGGFVAGYFFAKSKFIHTILTAIIFMIGIIYPEIYNFTLEIISKERHLFLLQVFLLILFAAMAGGFIAIRMKRKIIRS